MQSVFMLKVLTTFDDEDTDLDYITANFSLIKTETTEEFLSTRCRKKIKQENKKQHKTLYKPNLMLSVMRRKIRNKQT